MSSLLINRKAVFNEAGDFTEEYLDGRLHLVVNGVGIAEGVWYGSEGGVFYSANDLRESDPSWDHKPAVLKHPKAPDGTPISAASPTVINNSRIGLLLNTATGEDGKQRYKVWIDEEKANQVDVRIVNSIRNKEKIEVSTGMVAELVKKTGVWNGKKYQFVAKNIKPDHLAILLDEPGAYSVADGGGLLANSAVLSPPTLTDEQKQFLAPGIASWLAKTGLLVNGSIEETRYKLARLLASTYGEAGKAWNGYVEATFADKVVFSKDYSSGYWSVGYKMSEKDGVELVGEAVQVQSVYGFRSPDGTVMLTNSAGEPVFENPPTPTETEQMKTTAKDHVNALIANGQFKEESRAWLEGLGDGVTNIPLTPKETTPAPVVTTPVTNTPAPTVSTPPDIKAILNQLAQANPDMAYVLTNGAAQVENRRAVLVNTIKSSPGNTFTEEWLKAQRIEFLEGLASLATVRPQQEVAVVQNGANGGPPMFVLQNAFLGGGRSQAVAEEPLVAEDPFENSPVAAK